MSIFKRQKIEVFNVRAIYTQLTPLKLHIHWFRSDHAERDSSYSTYIFCRRKTHVFFSDGFVYRKCVNVATYCQFIRFRWISRVLISFSKYKFSEFC